MKLPLFLLVSIVAASDDTIKMIRGGGGGVATADDVATQKNTHNFYEAAAQGDFEEIPNHFPAYCFNNTNTNCNECKVDGGEAKFCGQLGESNSFMGVCDNDPCDDGYECVQCESIDGYDHTTCAFLHGGVVGIGTYKCVPEDSVFGSEHV